MTSKTAIEINDDKLDELSPLIERCICLLGVALTADNCEIRNLSMRACHKEN